MQIDMSYFYKRFSDHLLSLEMGSDLKELFNEVHYATRIATAQFTYWKNWKPGCKSTEGRLPSEGEIKRLAKVDWLKLTEDTMNSWKMIDKFGEKSTTEAAKGLPTEAKLEIAKTIPTQELMKLIDEDTEVIKAMGEAIEKGARK